MKRLIRYFLPWRRAKAVSLAAGQLAGRLLPLRNSSGLFFFFPFYQVGGAEKVHADIVSCVSDRHPWVFFTNRSKDAAFKPLFEKSARLFDISFLTLGSLRYYAYIGALAALINRHEKATVFGCNTVLFYDLLPRLRKDVRRLDLLHAFGGEIEHVSLPVVASLDTRVIFSSQVLADLKNQYSAEGVDAALLKRITFIDNQVAVPDNYPAKQRSNRLQVLYVGRGAPEKRVHLVGRVAALARSAGLDADFILVGDLNSLIEAEHLSACTLKGEIADPAELSALYESADVLLLTSSREGFPLVIMEAMAQGVVPISTDVGGISDHVKHEMNGLLISGQSEDDIVKAMVSMIARLNRNRSQLEGMSRRAYRYAREHFTQQRFCKAYRQLLLNEEPDKSGDEQ
ncbi:MAG TPA: glycosyltransferase [Pyrinomonadaceae bacterium]|jgi:glycosyltransferase involved in cell wall biosynthesis|nr:glycosyltransferase [Pyrinomonadaceae bacterium]